MKTVITSVGTSIFTNYQKKMDDLDDKIEDLKLMPFNEWDDWSEDIKNIKESIDEWLRDKNNDSYSAEIKSILKLKDMYSDIKVHLIATDTILSVLASDILKAYISTEKDIDCEFEKSKDIIKGLQVNNAENFKKVGSVNLVNRINTIINSNYYENIILNITGGYKATIPYMTIMGQINNIPIYYIFEDINELIEIPQAPIDIKWEIFEQHANILYDLENGIYNWTDYKKENNIDNNLSACIWEEDGMAELNAIGKIFWEKYKTFFLVKVNKGSGYLNDNHGNQNHIKNALQELYKRLMDEIINNNINNSEDLKQYILKLGDKNDLRHGNNPSKDKFIFKSTNKEQIRIVYSPKLIGKDLQLKIYDYVRGDFKHNEYMKEFKQKEYNTKELEFITIPIKKPQ